MINHRDGSIFLRFLIAGALNTIFGLAVYSLFIVVFSKPWLALLLGMVVSISFNFLTVGGYAFKDLAVRKFPQFFMGYVIIYIVNLGGLHLLRNWIDEPILAQAVLTLPMAFLSYAVLSRVVFFVRKNRCQK